MHSYPARWRPTRRSCTRIRPAGGRRGAHALVSGLLKSRRGAHALVSGLRACSLAVAGAADVRPKALRFLCAFASFFVSFLFARFSSFVASKRALRRHSPRNRHPDGVYLPYVAFKWAYMGLYGLIWGKFLAKFVLGPAHALDAPPRYGMPFFFPRGGGRFQDAVPGRPGGSAVKPGPRE